MNCPTEVLKEQKRAGFPDWPRVGSRRQVAPAMARLGEKDMILL